MPPGPFGFLLCAGAGYPSAARERRFKPKGAVRRQIRSACPQAALAQRRLTAYVLAFEFRPNDLDLPPTVRLSHDLLQISK